MISLNITETEKKELFYQLRKAAIVRTRVAVTIYTASEVAISTLPNSMVLEGGVNYDSKADITRSCSLKLLDPNHDLAFDQNNPADHSMFADNLIGVEYGIWLPDSARWVDIPVFRGPITNFIRQGAEVDIEAVGKEALAHDPHFVISDYLIPKGTTIKNAIKKVIGLAGESPSKCLLDNVTGSLKTPRAVKKGESPWKVITGGTSDSVGGTKPSLMSKAKGSIYIFYNGRGELTAKGKTTPSQWTFDGAQILTEPGFTYDVLSVRNTVDVTGGTPKKSKKHYHAQVSLPKSDPFSPQALARNGKPRHMVEFVEADSLKSDAACKTRAQEVLKAKKAEVLTAAFECMPNPLLEENDMVTLDMPGYRVDFTLKQWTLPLTAETMSVGFTKDTSRGGKK